MLETIDRLNINNLVLSDPSAKLNLPFIPGFEFSESDWTKMKSEIIREAEGHKSNDWYFTRNIAAMSKLNPERVLEWDSGYFWTFMYNQIAYPAFVNGPAAYGQLATEMKIFDQARFEDLGPLIYPLYSGLTDGLKAVKDNLVNLHRTAADTRINRVVNLAKNINVLFYGQYPEETLSDDIWEKVKTEINVGWKREDQTGGWIHMANFVTDIKILSPEMFAQMDVMNDRIWQGCKSDLDRYRTKASWEYFIGMAYYMMLLSAEDIQINENGIDIIMEAEKSNFTSPKTSLPERRRF